MQIKQTKLTKAIHDNFKLKKPFGLHGLYKRIQRFND